MLETEIKKLTAAVEELNATIIASTALRIDRWDMAHNTSGEGNAPTTGPKQNLDTAPPTPPAAAVQPAPAAPVTPTPPTPPAGPKFNLAQPDQPVQPALSFDQVKAQLSAVIQKMGDGGAAVSGLVATFPDVNGAPATLLSTVNPDSYPDLVAKAKELINA